MPPQRWRRRALVACPTAGPAGPAASAGEGEGPAELIGRALGLSLVPEVAVADPTALSFHPRDLAVVDVAGLHAADALARVGVLRALALGGVPLVTDLLPPAVATSLGADLAAAVQRLALADLADDEVVGAAVSTARLAALRAEAAEGRLSPPSTTIVLATRRPARLPAVARLLAEQVGAATGPVQVVVLLHGPGFGSDAPSVLRGAVPGALVVACDARQPFGSVLQAGVERADGALVAKLDDDDAYAPWHVEELALTAAKRSGAGGGGAGGGVLGGVAGGGAGGAAAIVGRAAEFVHLAGPDITVRRRFGITAGWADQVAGGALAVTREALDAVGGWAPLARGVDADLLGRVMRAGGRVFRCPPQGYLLVRHGEGHTWAQADEVFLEQADRHWRGLAMEAAGITP